MPRISKRFIYQQAIWLSPTTLSLQQAFQASWRARRGPNRLQPLDPDATSFREVIMARQIDGTTCGKLVTYTHGMRQETVRTRRNPTNDESEGSVPPPDGEEWSSGALFFAFDGNHVAVAQSHSLHISHLEEYLNWFMKNAGVIAEGNAVALHSLPPAAARRILERSPPKSVTFSRPVEIGRTDTVTADRTFTADTTMDALQSLLGIDDLREQLPANALATGRLKTKITLSWSPLVGGERPEILLRALGRHALRHLDEDPSLDVEIVTEAGTFTARKLSLAESKSFNAPEGVVLTSEVYARLVDFFARLRSRNEIAD